MPEILTESAHYITLKDAAKISGYSPDYLGQLIRKGKLAGKQVYLNVAWVTTEKALKEYLENNKVHSGKSELMTLRGRFQRWFAEHATAEGVVVLARRVIYVVLTFLILVCLFLAYVFIANLVRVIG